MATIINNPPSSNNSGSLIGTIVVIIVLIVLGYLVYMYGLPALRQTQVGAPQINIPSSIDVNVKQTN